MLGRGKIVFLLGLGIIGLDMLVVVRGGRYDFLL